MIILSYAVAGLGLGIVAGEKAGKDVGTLTEFSRVHVRVQYCTDSIKYSLSCSL